MTNNNEVVYIHRSYKNAYSPIRNATVIYTDEFFDIENGIVVFNKKLYTYDNIIASLTATTEGLSLVVSEDGAITEKIYTYEPIKVNNKYFITYPFNEKYLMSFRIEHYNNALELNLMIHKMIE
jgi:hypothetical protein